MKRSISTLTLVLAGALFVGACNKTEEGADSTQADTAAVQSFDTVNVPTQVPVTDTVVKTTTTETDTIKGEAKDTVRKP